MVSFLEACRAAAAQTNIDPATLGSDTWWLARWNTAVEADRQDQAQGRPGMLPAPVPATPGAVTGSTPGAVPGTDVGADLEAGVDIDEAVDIITRGTIPGVPTKVPPELTRYVTPLPHHLRAHRSWLLRKAEAGDIHAAYRLGILLTCDGRPQEAQQWLQHALDNPADALDETLDEAFEATPITPLSVPEAVETAYELGRDYLNAGQGSTALVFLEAAGQHGHSEAAYLLGLHYAGRRYDRWQALTWFSRAASNGHLNTQHEYQATPPAMAQSARGWCAGCTTSSGGPTGLVDVG